MSTIIYCWIFRSQVCEKSAWHTTVPDKINRYNEAVPRKVYPVVVACTLEEPVLDDVQIVSNPSTKNIILDKKHCLLIIKEGLPRIVTSLLCNLPSTF